MDNQDKDRLNSQAEKIAAQASGPPAGSNLPAHLKPVVEQFQAMQATLLQYAQEVNKTLTTEIKLETGWILGTPGSRMLLGRLLSGKLERGDEIYASRINWRLDSRFFEGAIGFGGRHMIYRLLLEQGPPRLVLFFQLAPGQHLSASLSFFKPPAESSLPASGCGPDWLTLYPFVQESRVDWYYSAFEPCSLPDDAPVCQRCANCKNGPHKWVPFDFAQLPRLAVDAYLFHDQYPPPIDPAHHFQVGGCRLKVPNTKPEGPTYL